MSNTVRMSIPKAKRVRGYEINRMPIGTFLDAMETLQALPGDLLGVCFPGMTPEGILGQLSQFDAGMLQRMISNAMTVAPRQIMPVLAQLIGIPEEELLGSPDIGLDGLAEIIDAWIEVNGLVNFIGAARGIAGKVRAAVANYRQPSIGSSV